MQTLGLFIGFIALLIVVGWKNRRRLKSKPKRDAQTASKNEQSNEGHSSPRSSSKTKRHVTNGVEHDPPPPVPVSRRLKGRAYVIDGDTIIVSKIKVRLTGIDAPELDQPWGRKSKWQMVNLCKGHIIEVHLTGETSYDRLVGTCYREDGKDVGAELIKAGLALDGGHFSKGKYAHLEDPEMRRKLRRYGGWRQ